MKQTINQNRLTSLHNDSMSSREKEILNMVISIGSIAPDFNLENASGQHCSLKQFYGKTVVLYFYPKDNTPGCIKQACAFRDDIKKYDEINAIVIGISKDSIDSHQAFIKQYMLPFILLSDPNLHVCETYGVIKEKKMFGKFSKGIERSSFIIDSKGVIQQIFRSVKADDNSKNVLAYLNKSKTT